MWTVEWSVDSCDSEMGCGQWNGVWTVVDSGMGCGQWNGVWTVVDSGMGCGQWNGVWIKEQSLKVEWDLDNEIECEQWSTQVKYAP